MKFNKKKILVILLFILTFCFNTALVSADCTYSFADKNAKSGNLTVSLNSSNSVEVKFTGKGSHYCGAGCDASSLSTFTIEDSKLYCPRKAYFCYDDGKNMIVNSPNSCVANPATISLSDSSGSDTIVYTPQESENGIIVCSKGGAVTANTNDTKLKQYESKAASYIKNPPGNISEIDEISSGVSSINNSSKYCDQTVFKEKNFDARLKQLSEQLTKITESMHKNGTITDSDYSNTIAGINKSFSIGKISLPTSDTVYDCKGLLDSDLQLIIDYALTTVQIIVPILLVIFVTVDFASAVISQDKDAMKKATSKAIKRGIAAIVVFFIPFIVKLLLSWAGITDACGL